MEFIVPLDGEDFLCLNHLKVADIWMRQKKNAKNGLEIHAVGRATIILEFFMS